MLALQLKTTFGVSSLLDGGHPRSCGLKLQRGYPPIIPGTVITVRQRMCGKIFPPVMLSPNVATFDASLQSLVSLQSLMNLKCKDFVSLQSAMKSEWVGSSKRPSPP